MWLVEIAAALHFMQYNFFRIHQTLRLMVAGGFDWHSVVVWGDGPRSTVEKQLHPVTWQILGMDDAPFTALKTAAAESRPNRFCIRRTAG